MPDTIKFSPSTCGFYLVDVHAGVIPSDAIDVDYKYYRELMEAAAGKVVAYDSVSKLPVLIDAQPTQEVVQVVSRRQARRALLDANLLMQVDAAIDAIQDGYTRESVRIDWQDAQVFKRDDATLLALASALNLSDEQLDQLFISASMY